MIWLGFIPVMVVVLFLTALVAALELRTKALEKKVTRLEKELF